MVALQTYILIRGTKSTFRWQNGAFLIGMFGMIVAFIVLGVASRHGFDTHFNTLNKSFGGGTDAEGDLHRRAPPTPPRISAT